MLWAAVLSAAALLAGCGGSDEAEGPIPVEAGSLSKEQFIKRANAICAETLERAGAAYEDLELQGLAALSENTAEIVDALLPTFKEEVDRLRSLGAPRGEGKQVSAFLAALQWNVDEAKAEPERFLAGEGRFARPAELARGYGLRECAARS